jgi:peptide/nickel transport system substrate-binding protein
MVFKDALRMGIAVLVPVAIGSAAIAQEDTTLRIGLHADIASANPGVNRDGNSDMVLAHVVEGLVAYDSDLDIQPVLAESWTISDDQTQYEITLRPDVQFHNGEPLTADLVVWNFERYLEAETNFQCAARFSGEVGPAISDMEVVDDLTVRFTFTEAAPHFLTTMATIQCTPWIIHPDSVAEDGSFIKPIGTGPYEFATWETSRYVELTAFDRYSPAEGEKSGYAGAKIAEIPTLRFLTVPDASTRVNGLRAGEIDVIDEIEPTVIESLQSGGFTIDIQPTPAWMILQVQSEAESLADVRIRQAIAHAINSDQLVSAIGEGLYMSNPSIIPPQSVYRTERSSIWPEYNIEQARTLLDEAGYDGEPISLLVANRDNRVQIATIIQAMLTSADINVELEVRDWATQLDLYREGDYELAVFAYSARLDPLLLFQSFIGDKQVEPARQWDNDEAAALLAEVTMVTDTARRTELFNDLHELMAEQVPLIGLFNFSVVTGLAPEVSGYEGWPGGTHRFWGVQKTSE